MDKIYNYDEESVQALREWFQTASLPKEIRLSEAENITDLKLFVESHLYEIDDHYPDPFYNPAITHLYKLKEKIEEEGL